MLKLFRIFGVWLARSQTCSGSARVEKGTSADENQVSKTSASRTRPPLQPAARAFFGPLYRCGQQRRCHREWAGLGHRLCTRREFDGPTRAAAKYTSLECCPASADRWRSSFREQTSPLLNPLLQGPLGNAFAGCEGALGRGLAHCDKPLVGEHGLNDGVGTVTTRHHQLVFLVSTSRPCASRSTRIFFGPQSGRGPDRRRAHAH